MLIVLKYCSVENLCKEIYSAYIIMGKFKNVASIDIYISGQLAVILLTEGLRGKLKLTNMRVTANGKQR